MSFSGDVVHPEGRTRDSELELLRRVERVDTLLTRDVEHLREVHPKFSGREWLR